MEKKRYKSSRQRALILQILRAAKNHPTADWIFEKARRTMPNISLGTVYRNLRLLRDEGKIQELRFGNDVARYDGDLRDHYHVRCVECGKVEDIPHDAAWTATSEIGNLTGYRILSHHLDFLGICPSCDHAGNDDYQG